MKQTDKLRMLFLCGAMFLSAAVAAEHGDDDDQGEDNHRGDRRGRVEEVDCKYKAKSGPHGYKEDVKCKSKTRFVRTGPPPWAPAHGYRRNHEHDRWREYGLRAVPVDIEVGRCNREVMGQVIGGAIGGLAGSEIGDGTGRLIAVAAGTLLGVVIGGEIGRSMDRVDRLCIDQALEYMPDGETIRWSDADRQYAVTPQATLQRDDGRYCREYTVDAGVAGRTQQVYGQACRQPDGSWQLAN